MWRSGSLTFRELTETARKREAALDRPSLRRLGQTNSGAPAGRTAFDVT